MTKVLITEDHLKNIAKAIRSKTGKATKYTPAEMPAAISSLETKDANEQQWLAALNDSTVYASLSAVPYDTLIGTLDNVRAYLFAMETKNTNKKYPLCHSIEMPNIQTIGVYAFTFRTFETLTAPELLTIWDYAFWYNTELTTVDLPKVQEIKIHAFEGCSKLQALSLPACNVIGIQAFVNCKGLQTVDIQGNNSIGDSAFDTCSALTTVSAPNIKTIGSRAFYYCTSLTSVDLSNCTTLNSNAFSYCSSLESIELPEIVSIATSFNNCTKLKTVTIGPKCTSIGSTAFQGSSALAELIVQAATPPTLSSQVFPSTCKIYVPDGSVDAYKAKTNWIKFASQIYGISERSAE